MARRIVWRYIVGCFGAWLLSGCKTECRISVEVNRIMQGQAMVTDCGAISSQSSSATVDAFITCIQSNMRALVSVRGTVEIPGRDSVYRNVVMGRSSNTGAYQWVWIGAEGRGPTSVDVTSLTGTGVIDFQRIDSAHWTVLIAGSGFPRPPPGSGAREPYDPPRLVPSGQICVSDLPYSAPVDP